MAGNMAAPAEALSTSHLDRDVEQLGAGDIRVILEIVAAGLPHSWQRVADGVFVRIAAEYERPSEVGLPLLEDRAQVQERDVAVGDHPIRRVLPKRLQSVLAGPHNPPMPVLGDTQHLRRQVADLVRQFLLTDTGADHAASLDLVEE